MREGDTALIDAVRHGRAADVAALLADGADVNEPKTDGSGATALYIACQEGHTEVVTTLLAANASVIQADNTGWTPLIIACQKGHTEVVTKLIAANASVKQATTDGWTPLTIACEHGHTEVVAILIAANASVDQAQNNGATPLIIASRKGHTEIVTTLVAANAKVDQATTTLTTRDAVSPPALQAKAKAPRPRLLRCHMALFFARKRCMNMKGRTKIAIGVLMASIAGFVVGVLLLEGTISAPSPSTCLIPELSNATASCEWYNYGRAAFWFPRLTNVTLASDGSECPLLFQAPFSEESACWDAWAGCRGQQCDISQYDASLDQVTCYGPEELAGGPSCTLSRKPMENMSSRHIAGLVLAIFGGIPTTVVGLVLLLCVLPPACYAVCKECCDEEPRSPVARGRSTTEMTEISPVSRC
jgi:ankyrin repeat protein